MHKRLLISLFTGAVLLSPCAHAAIDSKDAKAAQKEEQAQEADKVAEFMQLVKNAVETDCAKSIGQLERELDLLETLRRLGGICKSDYESQKAALQAKIDEVRQGQRVMVTTFMTIIKEGVEEGPESEAGQLLLKLAAAYDDATVLCADSPATSDAGDYTE